METNKTLTAKKYFFTVNFVYYIQSAALLFFPIVIYFIMQMEEGRKPLSSDFQWNVILPVVLIAGLISAFTVFRIKVKAIDPSASLLQKTPKYAAAILVRSTLLELPGLLASFVAYLTGEPYYLGGTILILLLFLFLRPTPDSMATDLNLSVREKELLNTPDAIIGEVNHKGT